MGRRVVVVALMGALAGCPVEDAECFGNDECPGETRCVAGVCVARDGGGARDGGQRDAAVGDAGQRDAAVGDAGQSDAAVGDAGQRDAAVIDAGASDAGAPDGG
ncbi:MAG: hypothetical protein RIT81_30605 [Deltaproteobacteria bacterium]